MTDERRADENKALRQLVDASREYTAARDALWSLGLFSRIFYFRRCVDTLNRYDEARDNVRNALQAVKEASAARAEAGRDTEIRGDATQPPFISLEEFEMLLGKPSVLRKRPPLKRDAL